MRRKEVQIAHLSLPESGHEDLTRNARTGTVAAVDEQGFITVVLKGTKARRPARLAIAATHEQIERAIATSQEVLLLVEGDDLSRPILVGFIEDKLPAAAAKIIEADVDGKRVRVVGQDEIVLECGSASITLRRNGRVVIKGTYVETHSNGTNRIKGGQVRIN